jgi:hypothetical protein
VLFACNKKRGLRPGVGTDSVERIGKVERVEPVKPVEKEVLFSKAWVFSVEHVTL